MFTRHTAQYAALALLVHASPLCAEEPGFYFFNFNAADGAVVEMPPSREEGFQVLQGSALIAAESNDSSHEYLTLKAVDPFSAVSISGRRPSAKDKTYLEAWVRPHATPSERGEEFIDFEGATVGFFKNGQTGQGEVNVFHALPEDKGYWLATGHSLAVNASGFPEAWFRIGIAIDWNSKTWDLEINGSNYIKGIAFRREGMTGQFQLRMYGQQSGDNGFDDLLISACPPDELESKLAGRAAAMQRIQRPLAKPRGSSVTASQAHDQRRQKHTPKPDSTVEARTPHLSMDARVTDGGKHFMTIDSKDETGAPKKVAFYVPSFDSSGNPLPLEVTIKCDAQLEVGTTLADIHWEITAQDTAQAATPAAGIPHGTFSSGPTQVAAVPAGMAGKGLIIRVGIPKAGQAPK